MGLFIPKKSVLDDGTVICTGDDQLHSFRDEPAVKKPDGRKEYYCHGKLHREKGPAVIDPVSGVEQWYRHGQLHREDGPAEVFTGPRRRNAYWLNGEPWPEGESRACKDIVHASMRSKTGLQRPKLRISPRP